MIGIGFEAGYYGFKTKVNLNKDDVSQKYKYHLIPVLLEATFYVPLGTEPLCLIWVFSSGGISRSSM